MTTINLEKLADEQLSELIVDAQRILKNREEHRRKEAINEIQRLAGEYGLAIEINSKVVKPRRKKKPRQAARPKYNNPGNPQQTWNGLGPRPKWLRTILESGKTLEELEIPSD